MRKQYVDIIHTQYRICSCYRVISYSHYSNYVCITLYTISFITCICFTYHYALVHHIHTRKQCVRWYHSHSLLTCYIICPYSNNVCNTIYNNNFTISFIKYACVTHYCVSIHHVYMRKQCVGIFHAQYRTYSHYRVISYNHGSNYV